MATRWQLTGDYFENCSCDVVCPCLVSPRAPLTSTPTRGACEVVLAFHIDRGSFDGLSLDGLNVVLVARAPGPMADGNWTAAAYVDERADDRQTEALGAIFTGAAGGPMAAFAPLIATNLGAARVPITYRAEGMRRSVEIPGVMQMAVRGLQSLNAGEEIWASTGHPVNPTKLALAIGEPGSIFAGHGMRWDNSGRNGHYAPIAWSA